MVLDGLSVKGTAVLYTAEFFYSVQTAHSCLHCALHSAWVSMPMTMALTMSISMSLRPRTWLRKGGSRELLCGSVLLHIKIKYISSVMPRKMPNRDILVGHNLYPFQALIGPSKAE